VSDEKRDRERLTVLGDLVGEVMVLEPMLIREIGTAGATIETRFPLQLDSLHDLRLLLGDRPVIVKGRVVHSHITDVDQDVVTYRIRGAVGPREPCDCGVSRECKGNSRWGVGLR
jgi:hypothetical protein